MALIERKKKESFRGDDVDVTVDVGKRFDGLVQAPSVSKIRLGSYARARLHFEHDPVPIMLTEYEATFGEALGPGCLVDESENDDCISKKSSWGFPHRWSSMRKLMENDKFVDVTAELEHGSCVQFVDYRGCCKFYLEQVDRDFLMHETLSEYGYAAPTLFAQFNEPDAFVQYYDPLCAPAGSRIEQALKEAAEIEKPPNNRAIAAIYDEVDVTWIDLDDEDETECADEYEDSLREGRFRYYWIHEGAPEKALRVAKAVCGILLGRLGLPLEITELIAGFTVHPRDPLPILELDMSSDDDGESDP